MHVAARSQPCSVTGIPSRSGAATTCISHRAATFYRPGTDRTARSNRPRVSPGFGWTARLPDLQRTKPEWSCSRPREAILFVAMTRDNSVWWVPLMRDGGIAKVGRFSSFFGTSGPDGLAMDGQGRLFVAHASLGHVFVLAPNGECIARVKCRAGSTCTNVAFGPNGIIYQLHIGRRH